MLSGWRLEPHDSLYTDAVMNQPNEPHRTFTDPSTLPALEIARKVRARELSPVEVVDAFVERIDRLNPSINAFVTLRVDEARAEALELEATLDNANEIGPLAGLPIGIKDLTDTEGLRTTYGSRLYADHVPTRDAAVVSRLKNQGAIIIGKTTTPEYGSHVVTHSPVSGVSRNPWRTDLTPGGSSGGSAAAVAACMLPFAHGTDGGGSIRVPASHCGVVGFKPSYGRISNVPTADLYTSLAHHGPITRTVSDAWYLFRAMAGHDPRDPGSLPDEILPERIDDLDTLTGSRVAYSPDLGYATVDPVVDTICRRAMGTFEGLGAAVTEAHPGFDDPRPYFNVLLAAHVAAVVMPDALPERRDFDAMTHAILDLHERTDAWMLADALRRRTELFDTCHDFFEQFDVLVTPTIGSLPLPAEAGLGPDMRIEGLYFNHPFNLTHLPAVSVPAGWTDDGIPVGIQIVVGARRDFQLMRVAAAFERASPWAHRQPPCHDAVR